MAFALKASTTASVAGARPSQRVVRGRSVALVVRAQEQGEGFISRDNSGRSNNFPTMSKAYVSSPTSSAVAGTGLGGPAGIAILVGTVAAIGLATVSLVGNPSGETLQMVVDSYSGESLSTIASRISASL